MPRCQWPPYRTIRDLALFHVGRPALIIGGGESLIEGVPRAPAGAVHISSNDHGARFLKRRPQLARDLAFIVALDKIEERARADVGKGGDGQPWGVPIVSRHMFADYRFPIAGIQSSGIGGALLARLMGCAPIILTGMDLYDGGTYFDNAKAVSNGHTQTPKIHAGRWWRFFRMYPAQYRTLGCSSLLTSRAAVYDPSERAEPVTDLSRLIADLRTQFVKITTDRGRPVVFRNRPFQSGEILELADNEAAKLLKERRAVRVTEGEIAAWVTSRIAPSPSLAPVGPSAPSCAAGSSQTALAALS